MQRVAITGVGLVTPLGLTAAENVARMGRGESGIQAAKAIAVEGHPAQALASVAEFELEPFLRFPKNYKFMGRAVQFAMRAAHKAIDQSGIDVRQMDAARVGDSSGLGSDRRGVRPLLPFAHHGLGRRPGMDYKYLGGLPSHLIDRYICLRTLANGGLALLSTEFGIRGPNGNFTQKDTASAQALHSAYLDLLEERCDVAVAGGYDSLATTGNFLAYQQAGFSRTPIRPRPTGLSIVARTGWCWAKARAFWFWRDGSTPRGGAPRSWVSFRAQARPWAQTNNGAPLGRRKPSAKPRARRWAKRGRILSWPPAWAPWKKIAARLRRWLRSWETARQSQP